MKGVQAVEDKVKFAGLMITPEQADALALALNRVADEARAFGAERVRAEAEKVSKELSSVRVRLAELEEMERAINAAR